MTRAVSPEDHSAQRCEGRSRCPAALLLQTQQDKKRKCLGADDCALPCVCRPQVVSHTVWTWGSRQSAASTETLDTRTRLHKAGLFSHVVIACPPRKISHRRRKESVDVSLFTAASRWNVCHLALLFAVTFPFCVSVPSYTTQVQAGVLPFILTSSVVPSLAEMLLLHFVILSCCECATVCRYLERYAHCQWSRKPPLSTRPAQLPGTATLSFQAPLAAFAVRFARHAVIWGLNQPRC